VRDYLYVVDGALAYLQLVEAMADDPSIVGEAFNYSTEQPLTVLELVAALHPTAAVAGTPVGPALDRIHELEPTDRGRYAGPVGWVDANGDGEFALALRCAQLDGSRARVWAGAGIVAESDPDAEVAETTVKLEAALSALLS